MTNAQIERLFTYTPLDQASIERVGQIREAGLMFAAQVNKLVPDSTAKDSAIQHILEAVMLSNCAVANDQPVTP